MKLTSHANNHELEDGRLCDLLKLNTLENVVSNSFHRSSVITTMVYVLNGIPSDEVFANLEVEDNWSKS